MRAASRRSEASFGFRGARYQPLSVGLALAILWAPAGPLRAAPSEMNGQAEDQASAPAPASDASDASSVSSTATTALAREEPAAVDPREEAAREAFREASRLFHKQDFKAAGDAFLRSFEILPSIDSLWAAANSYRLADEVVRAAEIYERYFQYVDDNRERAEKARAELNALRERVGRVNVQIAEEAEVLEILVNGEPVAREAFPRLVAAGPVEVEFRGAEPGQRSMNQVQLDGRSTIVVSFPGFGAGDPETPGEPSFVDPPEETPTRARQGVKAAFWTGVGLTAAGAVTVGVLGGMTLRYRNEWLSLQCPDGVCAPGSPSPEDARQNFERYKPATNVAIGVTAGVAAVTLILGVVAYRRGERPVESAALRGRMVARRPQLRVGAGGLGLRF